MLWEYAWISVVLGLVAGNLIKTHTDRVITAITLLGLSLYYFGHYHIGINGFAHDPKSHIDAIDYIAKSGDWLANSSGTLVIKNPLFYAVAALFYRAGDALGLDVWFAVRQFTLLLYGIYIYFSYQLIRLALENIKTQRLVFAALILWPIAFTYPIRISPDIAMGTAGMGVFYYLYRWLASPEKQNYLLWALLISAVSILVKINGVANLVIAGLAVFWLVMMKRVNLSALPNKKIGLSILLNLACIAAVYFRPAGFAERVEFIQTSTQNIPFIKSLLMNVTFNIDEYFFYITQMPDFYFAYKSFWSTFLSSFFTGNFAGEPQRILWQPTGLLWVIAVTGLLMYIYNLAYWCFRIWSERTKPSYEILLFFAVITPCAILLVFQLLTPTQSYGNARYLPHFVALFCVLYGRALEWQWQTARRKYHYFGLFLITIFMMASTLLFLITCSVA